ncbi:MAG TPA: lactonase family protein [Bryobacteraceae bacterium]|nr:lactonase family protein [Bryobacteraceae bacterium]
MRLFTLLAAPAALAMLQPCFAAPRQPAKDMLVYVGTYTKTASKGIYAYRLKGATGELTPLGLVAETVNPSFVALHPNGRYLYAVSETTGADGQKSGSVSAFSIDRKTAVLKFLNKVSSHGAGPCYVRVDNSGKAVAVANYGSGSIASFPIKADGTLGEAASAIQHTGSVADAKRQGGPHAHSVNFSPDNKFAVAADLGLDELLVYRLDPEKATLTPNTPPFTKVSPRSGPRHFAFHPGGKFAYVINEISLTVTGFAWDAKAGVLKEVQTISTVPANFKEGSTAEVQVHPSGKFLYGSNRGHDSIAVFSIDPRKGTLTAIEHVSTQGKTPRNFGIDPTGSFLIAANQDSDKLVVFRIDQKTGRLTPTGQTLDVPMPVCVKFLPVQ